MCMIQVYGSCILFRVFRFRFSAETWRSCQHTTMSTRRSITTSSSRRIDFF